LHSLIKITEQLEELKIKAIDKAKRKGINKAKSQLLSFSFSHIIQTRVATKKLKEVLTAKGLVDLYKECEYDIEYDQINVRKRKGGENTF
jgi:hypothetical protein